MELLRNILEQVQGGKTHFLPQAESQEDLASFQSVAAALKQANTLGYLSAVFRESRMRDSYGFVLEAIVNGPLSYEGLQYLSTPPPAPQPRDPDIFQLKPSLYGIGIDLRAAVSWLKRRFRR